MKALLLSALVVASLQHSTVAQAPSSPPPDGIGQLLERLEAALLSGDPVQYAELLSGDADPNDEVPFIEDWIRPGVTRAVVNERARGVPGDSPAGTAYELFVETLLEVGPIGRVGTWLVDVRQGPAEEWRIHHVKVLTTVQGLHRLAIRRDKEYAVANLIVSAEDLEFRLPQGTAFVSETPTGITGMVLLGRGEMTFSPTPASERGQVKIFSGSEILQTRFDAVFLRLNPDQLSDHLAWASLEARPVDPRNLRRAEQIFQQHVSRSFSLSLGDLSRETWSLIPKVGDFLAEIDTARFDHLTYMRFSSYAEDIRLSDGARKQTISIYASKEKLASRGSFFTEDDEAEFDILSYDIEASFDPRREWLDARARVVMRTRPESLDVLTMTLADPLLIRSVYSERLGHLLALRVAGQNGIVIQLPQQVPSDTVLDLEFTYGGELPAMNPELEALEPGQRQEASSFFGIPPEPSYVYSNRSQWYPQGPVTDYATATLQLRVPESYASVATGNLDIGYPRRVPIDGSADRAWNEYRFHATQPVRYLTWAVSRFFRVDSFAVSLSPSEEAPQLSGVSYRDVDLAIEAVPMQQARARGLAAIMRELTQFYASLLDDLPYPSFTLAVVERERPGGHSPAYFATLNMPPPATPVIWRGDPAFFDDFPEFFIAHEMAHQWWGHAVGWKNFHEQWLSEGFAQYFAALYAERFLDKNVFTGVIRQMSRWTREESDEGPVYLGYRLGHLKNNSRVFRALVYNKGALVLHMLRRLVGDEAFFASLRRFYADSRFRKAGTEDLRLAFEAESGRPLERFFDRWIYGATLPRIRFAYRTSADSVTVRFEQLGEIFDVPVTVTLQHQNRQTTDVIVPLSEPITELRIPIAGPVRRVEVNRDDAAPVQFVREGSAALQALPRPASAGPR